MRNEEKLLFLFLIISFIRLLSYCLCVESVPSQQQLKLGFICSTNTRTEGAIKL